jgi:hypothetical protein
MNGNQLHLVMPHKTRLFSKADVKTFSLIDRDSVVNGSCFVLVISGRLTDWRCWAVRLSLWLGHCIILQCRLGPKFLRHVLRRCLNDRNPPTCTASLLNVMLVTVCYLLRWNEPAELITVVNRSRCWVSLMMRYDSRWSTSPFLYFASRFFPRSLSPTPFCRILSREPDELSLYSDQTTDRTNEEKWVGL